MIMNYIMNYWIYRVINKHSFIHSNKTTEIITGKQRHSSDTTEEAPE
jgi:hypothetical protein